MKKTLFIKGVALFLMLITAFSLLVACGEGSEKGSSGKPGADSADDNGDYTLPPELESVIGGDPEKPNFEPADYDGYEFTFICQPYKDDTAYQVKYMVADSKGQSQLLDAVFERNAILEKKYNVSFAQTLTEDLITTVRTQVLSGATEFDVIVGSCIRLASFAKEGMLLNLNSVEQFDLSKSYWDQNANEQLRIGNKLYFTNCDFNVQEIGLVVYFNKQVVNEYGLKSPYDHIKDNTWTLDTWAEMTRAVSKDMTGDGKMTEGDQFGTLYEYHNTRSLLYGSDIRATVNNDSGYPQVTLFKDPDKITRAHELIKSVFSDESISFDIVGNITDTHGYKDKWDYARSLFMQDLFLFHYEGTNILHQFGNMEGEFGIVPLPKYDEKQKEYRSMYPMHCAMVALPSTLGGEKLDMVATIFEDLNFHSKELVTKYWYETILKRRSSRDDESAQFLDVIKNGRIYDLGLYYDFGGIRSKVLDVNCVGQNVNTLYRKVQKAVEADIKHVYNEFQKIAD